MTWISRDISVMDLYRAFYIYSLIVLTFLILSTLASPDIPLDTSDCQRYNLSCTLPHGLYSATILQSLPHPDNSDSNKTIHLIDYGAPLTWCQSFAVCNSYGGELLVIDDEEIQGVVENFTGDAQAWISGTRKNHANGWTWVNETLANCEYQGTNDIELNCTKDANNGYEYAVVEYLGSSMAQLVTPQQSRDFNYICKAAGGLKKETYWHPAQKECFDNGTRLPTLGEITSSEYTDTKLFLGLQYRPWIWITEGGSGCSVHAIMYNKLHWGGGSRPNAGVADCLTVQLLDGVWREKNCETKQLNLFICVGDIEIPESTTRPLTDTTTPAVSTVNPARGTGGVALSVEAIVGIVLGCLGALGLIIGITVYCVKIRPKKSNGSISSDAGHVNRGADHRDNDTALQVNPYEVADLSALQDNHTSPPTEAAAFRPSSAQYAEVGGVVPKINNQSKPATNATGPSEYSLAKRVSEQPNTGTGPPATYGEIKKRDHEDETIIVDNQQYGDLGPIGNRQVLPPINPKPKPKVGEKPSLGPKNV